MNDGPSEWEYCNILDCKECGTAAESKQDYRGGIFESVSGKQCLPWADKESNLKDLLGENTTFENVVEHNFCRNPYGVRDSLWCFVGDDSSGSSDWEYCPEVSDCEDEEVFHVSPYCGSLTVKQIDYRGSVNVTQSGRPCQDWTSQTPHPHRDTPLNFPFAGLSDGNYCRNPGGQEPLAWCYVDDPDILFEYCDVPKCPEERECGTFSLNQEDYR